MQQPNFETTSTAYYQQRRQHPELPAQYYYRPPSDRQYPVPHDRQYPQPHDRQYPMPHDRQHPMPHDQQYPMPHDRQYPQPQYPVRPQSAGRVVVDDERGFNEQDYYTSCCCCMAHIKRQAMTALYMHGLLCFGACMLLIVSQFHALELRDGTDAERMKYLHQSIANGATLIMVLTLLTIGCASHAVETETQPCCMVPHMLLCALGVVVSIAQMVAGLWLIVWDVNAHVEVAIAYVLLSAFGAVGVPLHAVYLYAVYRTRAYVDRKRAFYASLHDHQQLVHIRQKLSIGRDGAPRVPRRI